MPARPPGTLRLLLRPSMFLLHLPALAGVVAAVLLGLWQVESWQERRQDRAAELADADPVPLADVLGPDDPYPAAAVGQPVTVAGEWLDGAAVYVSGKPHDGGVGYWVVGVLATCGASPGCADPVGLPVVLGSSREPSYEDPSGSVELTGWLQPGEGAGDPDPDPDDDVLTSLRVATLLQRGAQDMYGAYLLLDEPASQRSGLEPVTPESLPDPPTFTALRNLLYGVEWWVFAGFAVFLWWRWSRDEVEKARRAAADVALLSGSAEAGREDRDAPIPSRS